MPAPVYRVYDFNASAGGPIVKDKLWYYMSVREQGSRQNTLNVFYNKNAGNASSFIYDPDLSKPAFSDRTWENYTPRITWQITSRNKITGLVGRAAGLPQVHGHDVADRLAELRLSDLARSRRPRRVQPAACPAGAWTSPLTNKLLLEAGLRHAPTTSGAASELDREPDENLVQMVNLTQTITPDVATRCGTARSSG